MRVKLRAVFAVNRSKIPNSIKNKRKLSKVVIAFMFSKLLMHGLFVYVDINLAEFAEIGDRESQNCHLTENDIAKPENSTCYIDQIEDQNLYNSFLLYACLVAGTFTFGIIVGIVFYRLIIVSTRNVHDIALAGLFKSPMRFFNINPPGRLLNRFSQDLGKIDEFFPVCCDDTLTILLQLIGVFCVAIWANWFSAIITIPVAILLIYLRQYYIRTSREIKRLDSILRSPIYNHISSTVTGRSSIKAFKLEQKLINRFDELQDNQGGSFLLFCAASRKGLHRIQICS